MGILTVRLTDEEEEILSGRARSAQMKKATFVRQLIRDSPLTTAAEVLADAPKRRGDPRLRVRRR